MSFAKNLTDCDLSSFVLRDLHRTIGKRFHVKSAEPNKDVALKIPRCTILMIVEFAV